MLCDRASVASLVILLLSIHSPAVPTQGQPPDGNPTPPPATAAEEWSSDAENSSSRSGDRSVSEFAGEDITQAAAQLNARSELPPAEYEPGGVTALAFDPECVKRTDNGFVIELPSESPVPTPTIYRGRLYVSGGFSSEEYYCFDATTSELIWASELDDDGPSSCVPYDDLIIFGCESCTLFALDAATGKMRWSHWLGDPLLSMPAVAGGRVFAVYPATSAPPDDDAGEDEHAEVELQGTHIVACFDAATGKVLWRHWIDSDCLTAPVAAGGHVFVASLTGNVYRFRQKDGRLLSAHRSRATSVPVIVNDRMYLTRRGEGSKEKAVTESIVLCSLKTNRLEFLAARRAAPYLDQAIQRKAAYSVDAETFEMPNGIGGGFGGGFGSGGQFAVGDEAGEEQTGDGDSSSEDGNASQDADSAQAGDALSVTQLQAADNIGLGNVSTLQNFHGSRVLFAGRSIYSSMGDRVVCADAKTGRERWSRQIEGDLVKLGGHLATPPVFAGDWLLVGTIGGQVLMLEPATGKTIHTFDIGSPIRCPPVASEGRLYVSTQDGKVVCIGTRFRKLTGWPMWGGDGAHSNIAKGR